MNSPSLELWKLQARQWSHVGSPLRPSPEDSELTCAAIAEWLRTSRRTALSAIVLGVTPELCSLPLPAGSRVMAVDHAEEMIRKIWPGRVRNGDEAICGDWRWMPLKCSAIDLALGDGSLSTLVYPSAYATALGELRRVFRPESRFIIRSFMCPQKRETTEQVFEELCRGRIGSFHALKLRLWMSVQNNAQEGVAVKEVRAALLAKWPDLGLLARRFRWPLEDVMTIESYANSAAVYTFATLAEYREIFRTCGFSVLQMTAPSYELGERCPTFVLEATGGAVD